MADRDSAMRSDPGGRLDINAEEGVPKVQILKG